jgi:hypothetical protein
MGMRITNFRQQVEQEGTDGGHKNAVIAHFTANRSQLIDLY